MRVHFEIPPVDDDTRARDAIVERDFVRPNRARQLIVPEDAFPRQVAEIDVLQRATRDDAQRSDNAALDRKPRGANRAADAVEVRAAHDAVAVVGGAIPLAVVAEAIRADQAGCEPKPPAVPIGGRLRVGDDRIAALGTGARIERDPRKRWLWALRKAHGTRPVVMPRQPESVDRAVPNSGIEMVNPIVSWIRLAGSLGSEPAGEQHGNERATGSSHRGQVCSYKCAVSRILASVPSCAA